MGICLSEPVRCMETELRPSALILRSDRYGWQVLLDEIRLLVLGPLVLHVEDG